MCGENPIKARGRFNLQVWIIEDDLEIVRTLEGKAFRCISHSFWQPTCQFVHLLCFKDTVQAFVLLHVGL